MKFFKRLGIYKASNVTYNPQTKEAFSYKWWKFSAVIKGKLVFNKYTYSPSTTRHQSKVRSLISYETPMILIECPKGLQDLQSGIDLYLSRIEKLVEMIEKPGTHKAKNLERIALIEEYQGKIKTIKKLMR